MAKKTDLPEPLLSEHPIAIRLGSIAAGALDFYELNVTANEADGSAAQVEALWRKYPKVCAAKMRVGNTIIGKVLPKRTGKDLPTKTEPARPVNLTKKQIEALGLTDEQLRAFAGIGVETEGQ